MDPFDLLFRRLSFEGEIAVIGPLAVELRPSWIWGSPDEFMDAGGFAFAGNIVLYPGGKPMNGFWIKGSIGYETFAATLTHPGGNAQTKDVASPVFGLMIGSSNVFSRNGGFIISGGAGIGVATADPVMLSVEQFDPNYGGITRVEYSYYDKAGRIKLLTSLALGVAF
jgi:hypothetical protein